MNFKRGDKVVCINPTGDLEKYITYTVDNMGKKDTILINGNCYRENRFVYAGRNLPNTASSTDSSKIRKNKPLFSGCLMYFPDALLAVAEHSKKANDKHNPGEPLHWSKDKSKDHADCIGRHLLDIGPDWTSIDPEFGSYHATALAWRALALLQTVIEREKQDASNKE